MAIIKVDISRNLTHPSVLACETIGGPKKVKDLHKLVRSEL